MIDIIRREQQTFLALLGEERDSFYLLRIRPSTKISAIEHLAETLIELSFIEFDAESSESKLQMFVCQVAG